MPPLTAEALLTELSLLADQLAITIDDRFDITLTTAHSDGVWFWYIADNRVEVSKRFAELCNQPSEAINSLDAWINLVHEDDRAGFTDAIRKHLSGVLSSLEVRYRISDGKNHFRWVVMRGALQRDARGNPMLLAGTQSDITPLVAVDQESSMPNELALVEWINLQLKHATEAAVALVSIDGFSELADSLSVSQLKLLKSQLKKRMQHCFPLTTFIAKLTNETFGVGYLGSHEQLQNHISQLFDHFVTPLDILGHGPLKLNLSVGMLVLPSTLDDAEPDAHLSALWSAVRKARESAGNTLVTFDQTLRQEQQQRLRMKSEVNSALKDGRVVAYLQPIIDAQTHEVTSFEALVRIRSKDGGLIPPGAFIPIVEQSELIVPLTNTVMRQALSALKQFIDSGLVRENASVAVNIAPHHLLNGQLPTLVIDELSYAKLAPSALKLEVTETALVDNIAVAVEQLSS